MNFIPADRTLSIKASPTLAIAARAKELISQGKNIINLAAGEPDLVTPTSVKQAAIAAIDNNQTYYTDVAGTLELRQAIVNKFKRDNSLTYTSGQILVSSGAKHGLYNLAQALINPGDEVIIPAPYWVSYPDIVALAQGKSVFIESKIDTQFKITPEQLEAAITDKTKLLILNSPSNPTGSCYSKQELAELGKILRKYPQVYILSDDIYEYLTFTAEPFYNIVTACPDLYERTIVFNGVSKGYSMTGWRIGYAAGNEQIIKCMKKIQSQNTSNPCSISQAAALEAIGGSQDFPHELNRVFKQRHDALYNALASIDGVKAFASSGSFYSFPDFSGVITRLGLKDDLELTALILDKALVSLVPGSAFGAPGCMRFSFTHDTGVLLEAVERIKQAIA
jgi:aspartate aminotransferase